MPGYEVSAKKTGLLPWKWAADRLKKSRQYWIATTRPDGAPHLMIIWGVWLDDSFWFSTGAASRKARNLAANPKCVIGTDDAAKAAIIEGYSGVIDTKECGVCEVRDSVREEVRVGFTGDGAASVPLPAERRVRAIREEVRSDRNAVEF